MASYLASASTLNSLTPEARQMLVNSARAEELASEILARKHHLVDLDRQRQECMQALATFRNKTTAAPTTGASAASATPSSLRAPPSAKLWVSFSSNFVKLPRAQVATMLAADRTKLDEEIASVRSEMKELMQQLQGLQQSLKIPKAMLDFALKQ